MKNENIKWLLEIVLLGAIYLVTRLVFIIHYPIQVRDAYSYKEILEQLVITNDYNVAGVIPKLSLFLLGIPHYFLPCDLLKCGVISNVVIGLLLVLVLAKIVKAITSSESISLILCIVLSTHPKLIEFSCQMLRENSYLFFLSLAILFLIQYNKKNNLVKVAGCAICIALATHCRYEALEILIVGGAFIFFFTNRKKRIRSIAMLFIAFLVVYIMLDCLFLKTISVRSLYDNYQEKLNYKIE